MQPDPRIAGSAVYAWIAEDLLFHGVAYGQVLDAYSATDGGRVRAWTRVSPERVTVDTDFRNTVIESYQIQSTKILVPVLNKFLVSMDIWLELCLPILQYYQTTASVYLVLRNRTLSIYRCVSL